MACDLQYTHSAGTKFKGGPKMMRLDKKVAFTLFGNEKAIVGACGNASDLGSAWVWLTDPTEKMPRFKNLECVAVVGDGRICTSYNDLGSWIVVDKTSYAVGSGGQFAMGAMAAGRSPVTAVEIASGLDPNSGLGVTEYKL